jgi:hypothetical protein
MKVIPMNKKISSLAVLLILMAIASTAIATVDVDGYTKQDGTYVRPHHRSDPNNTTNDNWSTKGNTNPYTGKAGTK